MSHKDGRVSLCAWVAPDLRKEVREAAKNEGTEFSLWVARALYRALVEEAHERKQREREALSSPILFALKVAIRTRNPNNGAQGNSRLASILRAKERKAQRSLVAQQITLRCLPGLVRAKEALAAKRAVEVLMVRVAPSSGLDPHDGLGAALKSGIDGVADALGLQNDRLPHLRWTLDQRRGRKGEYAVEILARFE